MAGKVGWTLLPRAVKPAAAGRSQASALRGLEVRRWVVLAVLWRCIGGKRLRRRRIPRTTVWGGEVFPLSGDGAWEIKCSDPRSLHGLLPRLFDLNRAEAQLHMPLHEVVLHAFVDM